MENNDKGMISRRIKLGSLLIVLFLLLYIPSAIFWVYGKNVSTAIIRMGEIEDSINTDAYIIRNEKVLNSPISGKCIKEVQEGEKVKVNARIATVLNKSSETLLNDLKNLDARIIDAQKEKSSNDNFFSADVKKIEDEIEEKLKIVIKTNNTNNLSAVKKLKSEIDGLIEKKAFIIGDLSKSDVHLKDLLRDKKSLQDRIKEHTKDIISQSSGTISFRIDGYEDMLTPGNLGALTKDNLSKIEARISPGNSEDLNVESGKPYAKVIQDIEYYIAFVMNDKRLGSLKVGSKVNVRINDINAVLDGAVSIENNENQIMTVKVDKALSETAGLRKINIDLIKSYYSGLKVPLGSLSKINDTEMTAQIALVKANRAKFTKVKIVGKNNEFAIIEAPEVSFGEGISLYSSYIVNPKNIEEGQIIN